MSNTNNTRKVISSFYFLDNDLQLQKIVTSKNVISAIHEQELNGLIRADIELDLSYSKFLVAGIDYVGYHYKDNFYLHKIQRVEHDHVDEITKVVLRHIFFEDMLYGKIIKDIRPVNREASYVLRNTIDTHSRWRTVMTDVTGSLSTNFYWQVMYEVIEFVTENYRIEYLPVLKFDGQKVTSFELHAANRIGEDKNIRIPFGSRVLELKYDVDYSEIVTRLVGHGKGEEVGDGYGRRIDFKDINFNKNGVVSPIGDVYMEDESITAMYGNDGQTPREGRIVFEDIEDPKELANETYNHYLKVSRPQMLFTADVADIGDVGIGDSVLIIRREHDVYFKARIHKLTVDLLNPNDAQIELGDYEHFKYSKVEKARAKSDKEFKKSTNNRIESLKRQFDTEFDAQVEEFRKEFEQKLIDVSAEIVADKEAFELRYTEDKETLRSEIQDSYTNAVTEANRIVEAKETDFKNYADGIGSAANGRIDSLYEGLGDLSSEFESLEIGGRNLIPSFKSSRWSGIGNYIVDDYNLLYPSGITFNAILNLELEENTNYTFTFNSNYSRYYIYKMNDDGATEIVRTIAEGDDVFTFNTGNHKNFRLSLNTWSKRVDKERYIKYLKLEKGTKPTDWTPAPEDTDQKLTIIANDLDGVQTKVENNTGAITTVTQQANGTQQRVIDAEGNINTITNLANGTQQTVTNMLNGTATKGTVFQNTVDGFLNRAWQTDIDKLNFENRNLLKSSNDLKENSTYNIARYYFDADIKEGEEVTVSLKGQLGSDRTAFTLYNSGGYVFLVSLYPSNQKDGIYTATFKWRIQRDSTIAENKWLNVYQVASTGTTASKIEWIKLERGSKATPYTVAPEDLMKYTDIVAKPDGFLIGSFEMGGDKIAQAIVGKAGAIDLIAQNVNFTGNVNVANQIKAYSLEAVYADIAKLRTNILTANSVEANAIKVDTALINKLNTNSILTNYLIANTAMIENIKSKSLEAVYANISELRTRLLVADVITANMVKFDTALIEKFTSSTAFINSLTSKQAFINTAKVTELISTDGRDSFTLAGGMMNWVRSTGQTMQLGIDGIYMKNSDGSIRFQMDREMITSASLGTSNANVYLATDAGFEARVVDRTQLPGGGLVEDYTYRPIRALVYRFPNIPNAYFSLLNGGEFRFTGEQTGTGRVYQPLRASGYYGDFFDGNSQTSGTNLYIRPASDAEVRFTRSGTTTNYVDIRAKVMYATAFTTNSTHVYVGSDGELRVQNKGLSGIYRDVRASGYYGTFLETTATNMYVRASGEVRFTANGTTGTYIPIRFKEWTATSHEKYKQDIEDWNFNVLDRFRNELQLSRFRFNNDEKKILQPGIIIHVDPRKDTFPIEWRRGDSFNGNVVMWWTVKGVQELAHENDSLKTELKELAYENDSLKNRINDLENKLNKIMEMIA